MNSDFKKYLLNITQSKDCEEVEVIQSLWSGYGKISRIQLLGSTRQTVVVKHISFNQIKEHPRGWNTDTSHQRKVKSYQVEMNWYENWNERCKISCKTPSHLGSFADEKEYWIVLEDLDEEFPLRKHQLSILEVHICLKWLANFHAIFISDSSSEKTLTDLWEIGTYWHLDTRPDELEKMGHQRLKAKAHEIEKLLNNCEYQTIVHGDAKLANFCFSKDGNKVAAVDFQYVGGGCGMKDVAYFLGSCLSGEECEIYETELLNSYFLELRDALQSAHINVEELEKEWREMYPLACADFTRFLLGWMPSHQKVNEYQLKMVDKVLRS